MYEVIVLYVMGLAAVLFATVQDIKTTEVSDWLNYSLIFFALGFRFFYSLFSENGFSLFYQGLIGLGLFFVIGNVLYYGKMFAGGDAKLMIALGAVLPFEFDFYSNVIIFVWFLFLFLIAGAIYSLTAAGSLAYKNYSSFKKDFLKRVKKNKLFIWAALIFSLSLFVLSYFEILFALLGIFVLILPIVYLAAKSIDEVCMVKVVLSSRLREGDWLYEDVKVKGKVIKAKWDGLTKKEILFLKKHKKKVKIRQGIAFVPVFLIAYVLLGIKVIF